MKLCIVILSAVLLTGCAVAQKRAQTPYQGYISYVQGLRSRNVARKQAGLPVFKPLSYEAWSGEVVRALDLAQKDLAYHRATELR